MKKIKEIVQKIRKELKSTEHYIQDALRIKNDSKFIAELYYQIANDNVSRILKLHDMVVKEIEDYKSTGKEPPKEMLAIWDWQHQEMIDEMAEIKAMIELFKR